jgi:hypothetical protein
MAKRTVTKGDDGFFRVSGQPPADYYTDKQTAETVARNLEKADDEKVKDNSDHHSDTVDG